MAKRKLNPIVKNWTGDNWPWFPDHPNPRRIIWIVNFNMWRPDEHDPLDDPYSSKQIRTLFDWAEEIATTDRIYDWGLKLYVVSEEIDNEHGETIFTFVKPKDLTKHLRSQGVISLFPEFHIRLIDTNTLDDWFLADFVPNYGWVSDYPWINPNFIDVLYRWGVSGQQSLKLADEVTQLLKKFYENSLSINDINLIKQKANRAKIISLPNLLVWRRVKEMSGYIGPEIKLSSQKGPPLSPQDIPLEELIRIKNCGDIDVQTSDWLRQETEYTLIRDCETLLYLELKDLVDTYAKRRCANLECQSPLPLSINAINGKRYAGKYCPDFSPRFRECKLYRDRQRQGKYKVSKITQPRDSQLLP